MIISNVIKKFTTLVLHSRRTYESQKREEKVVLCACHLLLSLKLGKTELNKQLFLI